MAGAFVHVHAADSAYLYHRDGRLRFGTFVGAYLTVLYVCGLGCFTLYPLPQGDAGLGITYGVAPISTR